MTDLLGDLIPVIRQGQTWFLDLFMVFLRVGAAMAVLPAFGEQTIPTRVRLAITVSFTLVTAPLVADTVPPILGFRPFVTEVAAGLLIGIALRLFVHGLQIAGTIIAQSTSLSQLFGGIDADPLPSLGTILTVAGLALALSAGLHVRVVELFVASYSLFPPSAVPAASDVARWGVWQIAHVFGLAFSLAAPFMVASLIYNLALGVINRAMPQLMVAMVGAPAITLGGLALFAVIAPLALMQWQGALGGFLDQPFVVPR